MQTKPRILWLEALEDRCVPAGVVTVTGWGAGNINLVGDAAVNDITVDVSSNGFDIHEIGTGTLTLNPSTPAGWVSLNTSTQIILAPPSLGQLFIDLKAGDDGVGVFGGPATLNGSLIVLPGDGDDVVAITNIRTLKQLIIRETSGNDLVVLDPGVRAQLPSLISLNTGNDQLNVLGPGTQFDSDLTILTGAGSDMVRFSPGQSLIQGNLLIDTSAQSGDGGDSVLVDYSNTAGVPTLKVLGNTTIRTGDGADLIRFGLGSGIGPSVELGATASNTITIEMGNHNDRIFAARAKLQKLTARLQNGDDQVLNNWGAPLGGTTTVTVASGSILDGGPHVSGDILPPGWSAPAGLTVVGFP